MEVFEAEKENCIRDKLTEFGMSKEWQDYLYKGIQQDLSAVQQLDQELAEMAEWYLDEFNNNPAKQNVFSCTVGIQPEDVKAVIVGQDPSRSKISLGYAFGTEDGPSDSLITIFGCLQDEYINRNIQLIETKEEIPEPTGKLDGWIEQGVFLINARLYFSSESSWICKELLKLLRKNINIVFIPMGLIARNCMPEPPGNMIDVYHPNFLYYNKEQTDKKKFRQNFVGKRPFLKCNWYLYLAQMDKNDANSLIDWIGFGKTDENEVLQRQKRKKSMLTFFKKLELDEELKKKLGFLPVVLVE